MSLATSCILDHNFWTRNLSMSFKVLQDLDFSLVFNKNLVKYYHLMVWDKGQMKWAKKAWNNSTYDVTHTMETQNQKFFSLQTTCQWRLAKYFKGLNSSL